MIDSTPKYLPFPLFLMSLVIVGGGMWYIIKITNAPIPQSISINEVSLVGEASGTATLTLSPGAISTAPNTESTLTLSINTGVSRVTGAQVEIIYEPSKIGTPVVTLGSFLPNVFVSPKIENGKIIFTLAAPPSSGGIIGSGTLATIKIKPTVVGTSSLSFGESNAVFAVGGQTNVLKLASDATITITDPNIK